MSGTYSGRLNPFQFNLNASNVPLLDKIVFYFNNDEPVPFAIDWEEFGESSGLYERLIRSFYYQIHHR